MRRATIALEEKLTRWVCVRAPGHDTRPPPFRDLTTPPSDCSTPTGVDHHVASDRAEGAEPSAERGHPQNP